MTIPHFNFISKTSKKTSISTKIFFVFFGLLLVSSGFFIGYNYNKLEKSIIPKIKPIAISDSVCSKNNFEKTKLKADLLKEYAYLILTPAEKIKDIDSYSVSMENKVNQISDNITTEKYVATFEVDTKEQKIIKIIEFFDYLSESIKSDLN